MSHDWPRGIARYGNTEQLLRKKKFLREEVSGRLQSRKRSSCERGRERGCARVCMRVRVRVRACETENR